MTKILVFGDSISWGAFDKEKGGWVERLKTYYFNDFQNNSISVYNLSLSGTDTREMLKSLENDIEKINRVDKEELILLFSIGSNDCAYRDDRDNFFVPKDEFRNNLNKILEVSKKHSSRIIFTGLMKIDEKLTLPWIANEYWENRDIIEYDKILEDFTRENNLTFIPLIDLINEEDLDDGLHPNTEGHKKIFERIKDYLE